MFEKYSATKAQSEMLRMLCNTYYVAIISSPNFFSIVHYTGHYSGSFGQKPDIGVISVFEMLKYNRLLYVLILIFLFQFRKGAVKTILNNVSIFCANAIL